VPRISAHSTYKVQILVMKKTVEIVYPIQSQPWTFHLTPTRSYIKEFGSGSAAICLLNKKQVWFHIEEFTPSTIAHELMHILIDNSPHGSANLDADQVEEVAAEILYNTWHLWAVWVNEIYIQLNSAYYNPKQKKK